MPNLGEEGRGGGGLGSKRHGYGVDLILIELKLIQKEDVVTELAAGVGCDLNCLKENSGLSEIASNIV